MLDNQNIMAFVATADVTKARPFYEDILGLKVRDADAYGINFGTNSNYLRMSVIPDFKAAPYAVLSWVTEDIYKMITALTAKGVLFDHFPGLGQDKSGVWSAPGGTKVAWFKDPDQNILSLTQFKI